MGYRFLTIVALIAFLVLASNGKVHQWLGLSTMNGTQAGLTGSGADILAVQGWANAELAAKTCGYQMTGEVTALRRSEWDDDPRARQVVAEVQKAKNDQGDDKFCAAAWAEYGPSGSKYPGLLERTS